MNLSGAETRPGAARKQASPDQRDSEDGYREKISQFISGLLESDEPEDATPDAADLLVKSIDVMQGAIARLKLAAYSPDKVIDIPRNACTFFEFHRPEEMAELGYRQAQAALDDLINDSA